MDSYTQGFERSYTVNSSILHGIEPRLKDFHQLLLRPPKVQAAPRNPELQHGHPASEGRSTLRPAGSRNLQQEPAAGNLWDWGTEWRWEGMELLLGFQSSDLVKSPSGPRTILLGRWFRFPC